MEKELSCHNSGEDASSCSGTARNSSTTGPHLEEDGGHGSKFRTESPLGKKARVQFKTSDSETKEEDKKTGQIILRRKNKNGVKKPRHSSTPRIRQKRVQLTPEEMAEAKVKCYFCSKTFSRYSSLRDHLAIHTGEKTFNCQICKVEFIHKRYLSSHNWNNHLTPEDKEREKAGSCYFCAKPFQSYSTLQSHLLIHTQEKHFNCSACKKQFTHKSHLDKHIFQHLSAEEQETEKSGWKHPCEFCGLRFKVQSTLYTHITIQHTKEKHYQCTICRKEFNHQGHLNTHLRTHSTDPVTRRPFSCSQCKKTFTNKYHLTHHEKTVHLGLKEFPCPQCNKLFSTKSHLTRHLTSVHAKIRYSCSHCSKTFSRKSDVRKHEKKAH